jgi:predicted transcriptional regulator
MIEYIDRILEQLRDAQWRNINEIKTDLSMPSDKLNSAILFLQELEFIDKKNENLKITSLGLKFLELPSKSRSEYSLLLTGRSHTTKSFNL